MLRRILSYIPSPFSACNTGWPNLGANSIDDSGDLWRRDIRKTLAQPAAA